MKFQDLREYISFLERKGQLRRITAPVDCELEITEIADRMVQSGGPALLFENVTGYDMPVPSWFKGSPRAVDLDCPLVLSMSKGEIPQPLMVRQARPELVKGYYAAIARVL